MARQKYNKLLPKGKHLIGGRHIWTSSSVERFIKRIRQFEIPMEHVEDDFLHPLLKSSDMQIYITVNVASQSMALAETHQELVKTLINNSGKKSKNEELAQWMGSKSISSIMKSQLHKCLIKKSILDADVDIDELDQGIIGDDKRKIMHLYFIEHDLYKYIVYCVKTRGGYHILFNTETLCSKYPTVKSFSKIATRSVNEIKSLQQTKEETSEKAKKNLRCWFNLDSNSMIPCPGTFQGSFHVKSVDLSTELNNLFS